MLDKEVAKDSIMFKNYFVIAFRGILRNKSYAAINIAGLALGITTCLIIFLIISRELSYDKQFANASNTYRVVRHSTDASGLSKSSVTPYPAGQAFKSDFPEVLSTQFHFQFRSLLTIEDEKMNVENIVFADSSFFDIFDFEVLSGNPEKDLAQPGKVFLTEEFASKLLKKDAKHFKLDNLLDMEIAGIIRTPAAPSHIKFNMVASRASLTPEMVKQFLGFSMDQWGLNSSGFTYVVLPSNITKELMESKFTAFVKKYYNTEDADREQYLLQPLSEIHFNTEYTENPGTTSTSSSILIVLGCIGLFILVIACVNFINLSTALSIHRSREVGVRKTLGAQQGQLALQYLGEAFLLTVIAGLLSVVAAEWLAPLIGNFLEKDIALNLFRNPQVIFFLGSIVLLTALFSGSYPALILSKFNPVKALKSKLSQQTSGSVSLRKMLVVLQFFIAQVLIICTLVVSSQLSYFREKPLGFNREAVVTVKLPSSEPEKLEAIRNKLMADGDVKDVTFALGAPMSDMNFGTGMYLTEKGNAQRYSVNVKPVDAQYKDVYGMELIEGRWFTESDIKIGNAGKENSKWVYVINETAVKTLGFATAKEAIGQSVTIGFNDTPGPVIGVVKDFHAASLQQEIKPALMMPFNMAYEAGIKIETANVSSLIKKIEEAWTSQYPEYLFEYTFLDQFIDRQYREEERMFGMFEIFAGIAIFIGCLGLYGLASFMAQQKTKEIAIRKSLGASIGHIIGMFSKEFILLIIIAFGLAVPVSWYAMKQWLQGFAFRVEMSWVVFAIGIVSTLIITILTVGYRSLRAAAANPVDSLKNE
jgi:putative ABC transport system permease protein